MQPTPLSGIAEVTGGRLTGADPGADAAGASIDSRALAPGDLFFAMEGEHTDGHRFVGDALERGAAAAVVREGSAGAGARIEVGDPLAALGKLASWHRDRLDATVIGITGSLGKTTTKDLLAACLATAGPTVMSPGSYNNMLGLPLTILMADDTTRYLVAEVGISRVGEMEELAGILRPDVAVLTCIAPVHTEGLGDMETIAVEKAKLLDALGPRGKAILNMEDLLVAAMAEGRGVEVIPFVLSEGFTLSMPGAWNLLNASAAVTAAGAVGVGHEACIGAMRDVEPPPMRMERSRRAGVEILNDAYNASPEATGCFLSHVLDVELPRCSGTVHLLLGEMLELGGLEAEAHAALATPVARLAGAGAQIWLVGEAMRRALVESERVRWASDVTEAAAEIVPLVAPGDLLALKGSRKLELETILEELG